MSPVKQANETKTASALIMPMIFSRLKPPVLARHANEAYISSSGVSTGKRRYDDERKFIPLKSNPPIRASHLLDAGRIPAQNQL
jgi:hypothetical protein